MPNLSHDLDHLAEECLFLSRAPSNGRPQGAIRQLPNKGIDTHGDMERPLLGKRKKLEDLGRTTVPR